MPNLGKLEDIADYMLDPSVASGGFTSGSESEQETDAEVEVLASAPRKVVGTNERHKVAARAASKFQGEEGGVESRRRVQKRAVKLVELGPRMTLRLMKVEEGLCGGKIMWHEHVTKSKEEEREMDQLWEKRKKEKAERKRIQQENVKKKRELEKGDGGENDDDVMMDDDDDFEADEDTTYDDEGNWTDEEK